MKAETDFKEGEECLFGEDGGQTRCDILKRELRDNDKILSFTLKALEIIQTSPFDKMNVGRVFEVWKRLDCWSPALWEIKEVSQKNLSHLS